MFCWKNNLEAKHVRRIVANYFLILFMLCGFLSCKTESEIPSHYFAVDSLINSQVKCLTASKAKLVKLASLKSKTDSTSYIPDSTAWSNELGAILQLDMINKPLYSNRYIVKDGKDPQSNLTIRYFEGKEDKKGNLPPVTLLKIYYQENFSNIKRIEGTYTEENDLYKSSQFLSIDLQDIHNKMVLTSYSIEGNQKMILADSLKFSVNARIIVK